MNTNEVVEKYLALRGYGIIENDYSTITPIVAIDNSEEETLVFVAVRECEEDFEEENTLNRKELEALMLNFLRNNEEISSMKIRFDCVNVVFLGNCRASIRHHINALSA